LAHRGAVLGLAGVILGAALTVAFGLPQPGLDRMKSAGWNDAARRLGGFGREFMPPLDEGALLFMPVLLPSTSLPEIQRIQSWQDRVIRSVPEVVSAAGKLGRAETPTDPAPIEMIETTIELKPRSQWRAGLTKDDLIAELQEKLSVIPGYAPGFLQPIENRVLMISTGIRAQLGVKLLGDDLEALQHWAFEAERVLRAVPGASGVAPSRVQGKPYVEVEVDRTDVDAAECRQVAYAIAHSPLVKTAFFASDPNLGRILAAVGYAGIDDLDQGLIDLFLDEVHVVREGGRHPDYREEHGQRVMKQSEITVRVDLHRGPAHATVWTCDLSHDYVSINADYRS
jgi:hypothetical protein